MTPEAESLMVGQRCWYHRSIRCIRNYGTVDPWSMVNDMLIIAASLIGGFIFASLLREDVDDDDHHDGGMLQPIQVPASNPI